MRYSILYYTVCIKHMCKVPSRNRYFQAFSSWNTFHYKTMITFWKRKAVTEYRFGSPIGLKRFLIKYHGFALARGNISAFCPNRWRYHFLQLPTCWPYSTEHDIVYAHTSLPLKLCSKRLIKGAL